MSANSNADSRIPGRVSLLITLKIPGRLPLWNAILAMHHWKRKKFKDAELDAFLSALRASAADLQMKTGFAKNTFSIAADTLELYRTTRQESAKSKRSKGKPKKAKRSTR